MSYKVYLSGEIHTQWRDEIGRLSQQCDLDIEFLSPITDHDASDAAGDHLGEQTDNYWRDHQSSKVNLIRTKRQIEAADLVIIRFGNKYRQWNAAFDAGYCAALGKSYITLHEEALIHPLKEVDASALVWAKSNEQVVETLQYILQS